MLEGYNLVNRQLRDDNTQSSSIHSTSMLFLYVHLTVFDTNMQLSITRVPRFHQIFKPQLHLRMHTADYKLPGNMRTGKGDQLSSFFIYPQSFCGETRSA